MATYRVLIEILDGRKLLRRDSRLVEADDRRAACEAVRADLPPEESARAVLRAVLVL